MRPRPPGGRSDGMPSDSPVRLSVPARSAWPASGSVPLLVSRPLPDGGFVPASRLRARLGRASAQRLRRKETSAAASPRCDDGEKKALRALPMLAATAVEGARRTGRLTVSTQARLVEDFPAMSARYVG